MRIGRGTVRRVDPVHTGDVRFVYIVRGKLWVMGKILGESECQGKSVAMSGQSWQYWGIHFCVAVLIDSHWVVSTAHCFNK